MRVRFIPSLQSRIVALALLVLAPACDEFPGIEAIGVRLGADGKSIEVVKVLCPGDRVTEVTLLPAPGGDPSDDEDDLLWKISSEAGLPASEYVVGVTPSGFVEDVPLSTPLELGQGLAATVVTERQSGALVLFEIRELRTDQILSPDGYFSPGDFEARHLERCQH
jgi:hypothetical protein